MLTSKFRKFGYQTQVVSILTARNMYMVKFRRKFVNQQWSYTLGHRWNIDIYAEKF